MITISEGAKRILALRLSEKKDVLGIRVKVSSAGCGGYAYNLEYSYKKNKEDILIGPLVIDPFSMAFLTGTRLEYKVEGLSEGFEFVNPNISGECGCGESFYV